MESSLYCSAERHLAKLDNFAAVIHSLALRISSENENQFSATITTLASYFEVDYTTIWRAIQALRENGWFKVLKEEPGRPVVYRVRTHKEWAAKHPNQCSEKIEFPFKTDDALGVALYAACNRRVKFFPNRLKALRATGFDDKELLTEWRKYLTAENPSGKKWNAIPGKFILHLRKLKVAA